MDKLDTEKLKNVPRELSGLKNKVDKLDIGKLEITPVDLSKTSNVIKVYNIIKTKHNELLKISKNINPNDTSNLV